MFARLNALIRVVARRVLADELAAERNHAETLVATLRNARYAEAEFVTRLTEVVVLHVARLMQLPRWAVEPERGGGRVVVIRNDVVNLATTLRDDLAALVDAYGDGAYTQPKTERLNA